MENEGHIDILNVLETFNRHVDKEKFSEAIEVISSALRLVEEDKVKIGATDYASLRTIWKMATMLKKKSGELTTAIYNSMTDSLTGLGNRRKFIEELARAVAEIERRNDEESEAASGVAEGPLRQNGVLLPQKLAVLLDVEDMKKYNRISHAAGDAALVRVAEILKERGRHYEFPTRWGGYEFGIVLTDSKGNPNFLSAVKASIQKAFKGAYFEYGGQEHSLSVYVTVYDIDGKLDVVELFRNIQTALTEEKELRKRDGQERGAGAPVLAVK